MRNDQEPTANYSVRSRKRLSGGLDVLDTWSRTASRPAWNAVYRALFTVCDGSVFRLYQTMSHRDRPQETTVFVRPWLVVTVIRSDADFFDIAYIGPPEPVRR